MNATSRAGRADVPSRSPAEEALAREAARLSLATEVAGFGIFEFDFDRGAAWLDDRASRITGDLLPSGRWLALDGPELAAWSASIHPDDRSIHGPMRAALRQGAADLDGFDCRVRRPDGSWAWLSQRCAVVERDPATGRTRRAVGIIAEITARAEADAAMRRTAEELERKVAERTAELAASEARFRAYFENAEDYLIDIEAMPDGRFLFRACNPAMERAHGLRSADIAGRPVEEVLDADMGPRMLVALRRCLDEGMVRYEPTVATRQGVRSFDTILYVVRGTDDTQRGRRILGSARDVTHRRELERRMAQIEKLSALGQLAGGIAHDINNVLQGVAGAAALIERRPQDPEAVRRLARLLIEAAERGSTTTRRLLAFARQDELRAEAIEPAGLLEGMREILTPALGVGIAVRLDVPPGLPPLLADKGQLETVLVNLATNARDAISAGGTLTLAARAETVAGPDHAAGLAPGRYLAVSVADDGAGMDAATLARATEPFFTTKPTGSGTGLGLAMARGFAEQSGGALMLASAPGTGTVVTLFLPEAEPAAAPAAETAAAPCPQGLPPLVLLADDDALVRTTLAGMLKADGYRVAVADSGEAALALLDEGMLPDALVTDLSMPGIDGVALIRTLQERRGGLPAVLLTGYAGDAPPLAIGGMAGHPVVVLRKPLSRHALADQLAELLAPRRTG